jgi:hypothetical protein
MTARKPLTTAQALLYGTLTVGTLDILDAFLFWYFYREVAPVRILQSITSGLLGRASFEGGAATAALGLFLHYFISFMVVLTYLLASRRLPSLARRPFLYGPLYGLAVYGVMNYIVVPLSAAASSGNPAAAVLINGLLIHAFGVGLPSALFARAASTGER